uniref:TNF receptor-associated factor n=1 Tax=Rhinopithecus roxellana TaxID=61622 RepID=A0A2K6NJ05_RHIRO
MSLLNCENSCGSSQSESDYCVAMASSCSAATKDDSVGGTASTGNLSSSFVEEIQGYDVEFDPLLESKYECPICLMALQEAVQTPCGHRFRKACIIKSIRDAGHKCPGDNEILLENKLFADSFAKRETLSLMVKCLNEGCVHKMELRHLEDHQAYCEFALMDCPQCQRPFQKFHINIHILKDCPRRQVSCDNCAASMNYPLANVICEYYCPIAPIPCTFHTFGCHEKMQRNHLSHRLQESTLLSLIPDSGYISEARNFQQTSHQLEDRLVRQDHPIQELTDEMETQSIYVSPNEPFETLRTKLLALKHSSATEFTFGRLGVHLKCQEEEKPAVIHSPGFYTGKPGYKLCMRLHLQLPTAQRCANYISLFVHTMQGEYDSHLPWPFQVQYVLQSLISLSHLCLLSSDPQIPWNPKGFGYVTFMHLEALRQRTFINDDTLSVRCEVSTCFDMGRLWRGGFQPQSTDAGV